MLTIDGLTKTYGEVRALDGVGFNVGRGERVALLGANGSGKTTTIRAICRLLRWDSGRITFNGASIETQSRYLRDIGAVLDGSRNTNWRLTAEQNARYFARLRGYRASDVEQRIGELGERLGLDAHAGKEVGKLSTGNRQKAALLCALAHAPQLLLLDEPTLGLDIDTVSELQQVILEQSGSDEQGFLITSHDMSFIERVCSRVVVLEQGRVIFDGAIEALKQQLYHYEMVLQLPASVLGQLTALQSRLWPGDRVQWQEAGRQLTLRYDQPEQPLPTLAWLAEQGISPEQLTINELTVESAYRSLRSQMSGGAVAGDPADLSLTKEAM